ncbi:RNA-binding protein [Schizosaccharomyces cryophilus OY26]|uniref:RNA-binding protein n=1 Tax=Schizosaccharomyces cryophilus (strain OY26 / ATCC MYA-4695 / CBS 11777 / NBRC 106824 / NRRL Y48691) TaxID=653667 RepID=S9VZ32_SCHCR|nr:RNA-binding protein [Schizosaccharomyces cryophilus OY26]EPY51080.1 RNA-binding protein [Schizosaccharomyces cryophilus OY26]
MKESTASYHGDSQPKDQSVVEHIVPSETIQTTELEVSDDILGEKEEDTTPELESCQHLDNKQEENFKSFDSLSASTSFDSPNDIDFSEVPGVSINLLKEKEGLLDPIEHELAQSDTFQEPQLQSAENKLKDSFSPAPNFAPASDLSANSVHSLPNGASSGNMYYGSNPFYPVQIIPIVDNPYSAHPVQCTPFQPISSSSPPFASQPPDPKDTSNLPYQEPSYLADFRILILSNLPSEYKITDLLSHIHAGPLERVQQKQEKNKVILSFLFAEDAIKFHECCNRRRFQFHGRSLKVTFARPSRLSESVYNVCNNMAASRNVFIGNFPATFGEHELVDHFGKFGEIDNVKILSKKNIAFIHYLNIKDAIRVVQTLSCDPTYHAWRIFYGIDRCEHRGASTCSSPYGSPKFSSSSVSINSDPELKESTSEISHKPDIENRTVFLGNLDAKVKDSEICDLIYCGPLQDFHYIPEKHICFVTFVDVADAKAFHAYISNEMVVLHGRRIKSGWGKASGPLPRVLETSISMGASRNVYFSKVSDSLTKKELELILRQYGEIESIKYLKQPNTGFVSYTNISNGMKAFHGLPLQPAFQKSKIQYARDRCDKSDSYVSSTPSNSPSLNAGQTQQTLLPPAIPFTIPMYPPMFTAPSNIKSDAYPSTPYVPPFAPFSNVYASIPSYNIQQSTHMQNPK